MVKNLAPVFSVSKITRNTICHILSVFKYKQNSNNKRTRGPVKYTVIFKSEKDGKFKLSLIFTRV